MQNLTITGARLHNLKRIDSPSREQAGRGDGRHGSGKSSLCSTSFSRKGAGSTCSRWELSPGSRTKQVRHDLGDRTDDRGAAEHHPSEQSTLDGGLAGRRLYCLTRIFEGRVYKYGEDPSRVYTLCVCSDCRGFRVERGGQHDRDLLTDSGSRTDSPTAIPSISVPLRRISCSTSRRSATPTRYCLVARRERAGEPPGHAGVRPHQALDHAFPEHPLLPSERWRSRGLGGAVAKAAVAGLSAQQRNCG